MFLFVASEIALAGVPTMAQGQQRLPHLDPVTGGTQSSSKAVTAAAPVVNTPIDHVVIIFEENISFGHYFGTYPRQQTKLASLPFMPYLARLLRMS